METTELGVWSTSRHQSPAYRPVHYVSSTSRGKSPVYRPLHEARVLSIVLVKQWESIQFIRTVVETLLVMLISSCDDDGDDNLYPNPNQCKLVFTALWRLTADLRLCKKKAHQSNFVFHAQPTITVTSGGSTQKNKTVMYNSVTQRRSTNKMYIHKHNEVAKLCTCTTLIQIKRHQTLNVDLTKKKKKRLRKEKS